MVVTEGENVGVVATVRELNRAGYEPWVAAASRAAPAAHSRAVGGVIAVPDPSVHAEAFARTVAQRANAIQAVAVLPGGEKGLRALSERAGGLQLGSRLAVCDRETVLKATDKVALSELAADAGLSTPWTVLVSAEEAARRALPVPLPAIVKPLRSQCERNGGFCQLGVRLVSSREQAIAALRLLPQQRGLIQPCHGGTLTGMGGVFWNGKIVAAVHQRALRTWPLACGQMSFAVTVARDPELERAIARFLSSLGWKGLFQLQFLETEQGRLLIDLNPRIYASVALAAAAGQNLVRTWVDLLLGRDTPPPAYRLGVCFRNEVLDTRALYACAGRRSSAAIARALAYPAAAHAYFEARDPMPLLSMAPGLVSTLLARAGSRAAGVGLRGGAQRASRARAVRVSSRRSLVQGHGWLRR